MYFWKTGALANDIKNNDVSEKDWMHYFIATTLIIFSLIKLSPIMNAVPVIVELITISIITIIGISITFNTNQRNNGSNYVARATALTLPITIKVMTISLIFGIFLGIATEMGILTLEAQEWVTVIFAALIQTVYFWRLNVHFNYISI